MYRSSGKAMKNIDRVYELYKTGMERKEIAVALGLSYNTVKTYVNSKVLKEIGSKEPARKQKKQRAIHFTSSGVMFR